MGEEKIIYEQTTICPNCWILGIGYYSANITTVVKMKKILCFRFYKIMQIVPYIMNPYYDGEYNANVILRAMAKGEKLKASIFITRYKEKLKSKES